MIFDYKLIFRNFINRRKNIMKKFAFINLVILILAFSAFGQKTKSDPAKDVRAAFDRLVEGIEQNDVTKVMSVYENSPRTLFFNYNGTATLGWEQTRANREAAYAKVKNPTLDVTGLRVEILSPTAAYVSCKWKLQQEYDGKLESSSGRMTLVFKKIGKEWKIVHLHTSPDAAPKDIVIPPSEKDVKDSGKIN
jgi:ketosteroid isomerase-like protein